MGRNIAAVIAIFLCTALAWLILGMSIEARTQGMGSDLGPRVESLWGAPQEQAPPVAFKTLAPNDPLALERSRVQVALDLEQRQKGLLWFPTYRVAYRGAYLFRNTTTSNEITLKFVFPVANAVYDDLVFRVDGRPISVTTNNGAAIAIVQCAPGATIPLEVGYRSQGMKTWTYTLGDGVAQVHDFILDMRTDFERIDFPPETLSPTVKRPVDRGWQLTWRYTSLVTGSKIGMVMPEHIQPGPMAGRISFFAPVSLLFFFFLIFIISTMKKIALHPMHYFFMPASCLPI